MYWTHSSIHWTSQIHTHIHTQTHIQTCQSDLTCTCPIHCVYVCDYDMDCVYVCDHALFLKHCICTLVKYICTIHSAYLRTYWAHSNVHTMKITNTHLCVHIYICIYIYIYIYTHTHTHTYIHASLILLVHAPWIHQVCAVLEALHMHTQLVHSHRT
jgi:hypothetical protein